MMHAAEHGQQERHEGPERFWAVLVLFLATYGFYYLIFADRLYTYYRDSLKHFEFIRRIHDFLQSLF